MVMSEDIIELVDDKKLDELSIYLKRGGDPNLRDEDGGPLLHYAVLGAHSKAIELLCLNGANINYEIPEGQFASDSLAPTCISLAMQLRNLVDREKYSPIVDLLVELGARDEA